MRRMITAFINSVAGLRHGFGNETAIREELLVLVISIPLVPILTLDPWRMMALWGSLLLILLTELLNTGIEQLANKITRDFSPEIKFAKDCGSAAVLMSLIIAAGVWGITVWEIWGDWLPTIFRGAA
ncbi:MAG: diacylglycerol kinase [Pseudomonadota bacterium]